MSGVTNVYGEAGVDYILTASPESEDNFERRWRSKTDERIPYAQERTGVRKDND